ncbi:MAG: N-acetylmuramoyl-L-alanine amidase [Bacteroidia bacterium]|nr:N-acetylmuramoyl-L-alanine amidase [Bacteroidia bacterium]
MPASAQSSPGKNFTVTIDAGHGGKDTGAPGKKSVEKNIALGIALKLGHYIESLMEDVDVYYIRKTDVFIPLYERAQIANRNKSDLFISVHVNANKKSALTGTSTYVMGFSKAAIPAPAAASQSR